MTDNRKDPGARLADKVALYLDRRVSDGGSLDKDLERALAHYRLAMARPAEDAIATAKLDLLAVLVNAEGQALGWTFDEPDGPMWGELEEIGSDFDIPGPFVSVFVEVDLPRPNDTATLRGWPKKRLEKKGPTQ